MLTADNSLLMVEWAKFKPEVSGSLPVRPGLVLSVGLSRDIAGVGDLPDGGDSQYQFPLLAHKRNTQS